MLSLRSRDEEATHLAMGTKLVLMVEYAGTRYHGFQFQINAPTIQGELEVALRKLTGEDRRVMAASRTDAGVHAKGQVVSFRTRSGLPPQTFVRALNHYLPRDIAVKAAYRAGEGFNVRGDAVSREYRYYIASGPSRSPFTRGFAYFVPRELDVEKMKRACQVLVGEHDFASFVTSMGDEVKGTVRNVYRAGVERRGNMVIFDMVASSFLPHQIRNTVGALIQVGMAKMGVEEFWHMARAKTPGLARPTSPACGLCLMRVNYAVPLGGGDENIQH